MAHSRVPKSLKLIDTRVQIEETSARDAGQIGFVTQMLAQFGLPYDDPGPNVHVYERRNGKHIMRVVSHAGIPYGAMPRILLAFACTEAIRTNRRNIRLGRNLSTFLRDKLDLPINGGPRGSINRVKLQAYKLFSSQISVSKLYSTEHGRRLKETYMNISDSIDVALWLPKSCSQDTVWESEIELSAKFFREVKKYPIPVDWRAIQVLKSSKYALDIYLWLTHRMKYLRETTTVPWFGRSGLYLQFGSGCQDNEDGREAFRRNATDALAQVLCVYPGARVESTSTGLVLRPSPTHVPPFRSAARTNQPTTIGNVTAGKTSQEIDLDAQFKKLVAQTAFP